MRPKAPLVTLASFLMGYPGATASRPSTISDSSKRSNGYDAVMCGEDGYVDGPVYSFNSDAWNAEDKGFQCLSVINESSPTSAGFDATWHWPISDQSVHSFPHVTFSSNDLPIALDNIYALRLAAQWAMSAGTISSAQSSSAPIGVDYDGLRNIKAEANVAFDLFLDQDEDNSKSAINADYEIMVWIGRVGSPYPLGYDSKNSACYTQQLGIFNFTLYLGKNARGTSVYTWVSPTDETIFDEDISPLLQYLWRNELVSADAYLGLVEFGSEAFYSENNVTFSAGDFSMQIWKGGPSVIDLNPIGEHCVKPTSPVGPEGTGKPNKGSNIRKGGILSKKLLIMSSFPFLLSILQNGNLAGWLAAVVFWRIWLH